MSRLKKIRPDIQKVVLHPKQIQKIIMIVFELNNAIVEHGMLSTHVRDRLGELIGNIYQFKEDD